MQFEFEGPGNPEDVKKNFANLSPDEFEGALENMEAGDMKKFVPTSDQRSALDAKALGKINTAETEENLARIRSSLIEAGTGTLHTPLPKGTRVEFNQKASAEIQAYARNLEERMNTRRDLSDRAKKQFDKLRRGGTSAQLSA